MNVLTTNVIPFGIQPVEIRALILIAVFILVSCLPIYLSAKVPLQKGTKIYLIIICISSLLIYGYNVFDIIQLVEMLHGISRSGHSVEELERLNKLWFSVCDGRIPLTKAYSIIAFDVVIISSVLAFWNYATSLLTKIKQDYH